MNRFLVIVIAFVSLPSLTVFAHGDHAPKVATCAKECTKEQIEAAVPSAVAALVKEQKVPATWSSAKVETIEKKTFKKGPEWVVTLADPNQKEKLYVFITTKGRLNGSNFTGN
jgi:hypothetical protein